MIASKYIDLPVLVDSLVIGFLELRGSAVHVNNIISCKNGILFEESEILSELSFNLDVELPDCYLAAFDQIVSIDRQSEESQKVICVARVFCSDFFCTAIPLYYHPLVIACSCINLAMLYLRVCMPDSVKGIPWYKWLDDGVELIDIEKCCIQLKDALALLRECKSLVDFTQPMCGSVIGS